MKGETRTNIPKQKWPNVMKQPTKKEKKMEKKKVRDYHLEFINDYP